MRLNDVKRSFGNKTSWEGSFDNYFRHFCLELNSHVFSNGEKHSSLNSRVSKLNNKKEFDMIYVDPPYLRKEASGSDVDYLKFYHDQTNANIVYGNGSLNIGNNSATTTINSSGNFGIGTSTPQRKLSIDSGASATTTVQFGDIYSGTGKACVEMPNNAGTVTSFYFIGTTMVIEANACK